MDRKKRYLVVLDANSVTGQIYASGNHDFVAMAGDVQHPVLVCTELETHNPYYIYAKRPLKESGSYQSLYLPHGSVAQILEYDTSEEIPPGFVRSR
jgi:hypothetical protein